jgi:hypothetical protein
MELKNLEVLAILAILPALALAETMSTPDESLVLAYELETGFTVDGSNYQLDYISNEGQTFSALPTVQQYYLQTIPEFFSTQPNRFFGQLPAILDCYLLSPTLLPYCISWYEFRS